MTANYYLDLMMIEELYLETVEKLNQGIRPQIKLHLELIDQLKSSWSKNLGPGPIDQARLSKILCLLDHTQNFSLEFKSLIIKTLERSEISENIFLIIGLLSVSQKHIIEESFRQGIMMPDDYLKHLKRFLNHPNPEIIEWTLKTIECLGPFSNRFKNEIKTLSNFKLHFMKFFNPHYKSSAIIISKLQKQWEK